MKPGPRPDEARRRIRRLMEHMSDRTFATYWRAFCLMSELKELGVIGDQERYEANLASTRPNGTLNVCKFARIADGLLMRAATQRPELFADAGQ